VSGADSKILPSGGTRVRSPSVLPALTSAHDGFFKGVSRYAREQKWYLVTDLIYTGKIPLGWRGASIMSFIGDRDDLAEFILSSSVPAVELSLARHRRKTPTSGFWFCARCLLWRICF
jgi:hypothetical protein